MLHVCYVALLLVLSTPPRTEGLDLLLELEPHSLLVLDVPKGIAALTLALESGEGLTKAERLRLQETRAHLLLLWEEHDKAEADFKAVLKDAPGNVSAEAHVLLVRELRRRGKDNIAQLTRLVEKHPKDSRVLYCLGAAHAALGAKGAALAKRHLSRAISLEPDYAPAYYYRGVALAYGREYKQAASDLRRYLSEPVISPLRRATAHGALGCALLGLNNTPEALRHLLIARASRSDYWPEVSNALIATLTREGKYHSVCGVLSEERKKASTEIGLHIHYMLYLDVIGRHDKAVSVGFDVARRFPEYDGITSRIAVSYCYEKRYREAADLCEKRVKARPKCYSTLAYYCALLATCPDDKVRDPKKAKDLAEAIEKACGTSQPDAAWAIACAAGANGDYGRATKLLGQALRSKDISMEREIACKRALAQFSLKKPFRMEYRLADLRQVVKKTMDGCKPSPRSAFKN